MLLNKRRLGKLGLVQQRCRDGLWRRDCEHLLGRLEEAGRLDGEIFESRDVGACLLGDVGEGAVMLRVVAALLLDVCGRQRELVDLLAQPDVVLLELGGGKELCARARG